MEKHAPASRQAVTALILDLFRLNSRLLIAGDRLVAGLGLTSARWQILGAIAQADRARPVAWLARDMGGARQNVQRIVNDLHREGLVAFAPNPHHRRAQLVVLTEHGRGIYEAALALWAPMADALASGLSAAETEAAHRLLDTLRRNLEHAEGDGDGGPV
jgi:DNA-binding MarR family transcriptional regulator